MGLAIRVRNEQGASEGYVGESREAVEAWLENTWHDVQSLSATVFDEDGRIVAHMERGTATLEWE